MIEQCILDVTESLGDLPLILFGDFNARTGNENSDAADTVDCGFDIFGNSEDAHSSPHRVSKDTVVNDFGRYLSNVCTEFDNRTKLFKIEKFQWDEEKSSTFMEQIASPYVFNLIREATD